MFVCFGRKDLGQWRAGKGFDLFRDISCFSPTRSLGTSIPEEIYGRSVTIVVAEIISDSEWLSDEVRAEQCRAIRHLLLGCLHSDLDVLLPKMGFSGVAELAFIVAATDEIGSEAISKRIREQFAGPEHFQQARLSLLTSYQSLAAIKISASESTEDFLANMAIHIQEIMNNENELRMVQNG